jgi:hypothetical protein
LIHINLLHQAFSDALIRASAMAAGRHVIRPSSVKCE